MSKKTPPSITEENIQDLIIRVRAEAIEKAEVLAKKLGKNVYPIIFVRPTKEVFIGFIQEPNRAAKMEAFDIMSSKESVTMAGEVIISTSIIREESHEAFTSQESKYDDVYMSACIDSFAHVSALLNVLKKK